MMAAEVSMEPGLDAKAQATFAIGRTARAVAGAVMGPVLVLGRLPAWPGESLRLAAETYRWSEDGESGTALRYRVTTPPSRCEAGATPSAVNAALTAILRPLVTGLSDASGLTPKALWRRCSDMVAAVTVEGGYALGDAASAMKTASGVLAVPNAPLFNRQTGFQHVVLRNCDGEALEDRWFLRRGPRWRR
ncbi:hypothetical protein J4558_09550 [Leptolyngbya sp. 15MV]|nr:hypothetical protein J4558_09550 [Leptolyngbya sp. 15MV]